MFYVDVGTKRCPHRQNRPKSAKPAAATTRQGGAGTEQTQTGDVPKPPQRFIKSLRPMQINRVILSAPDRPTPTS
eukprot:2109408-Pyramimonas_sp.AAC.2